MDQFFKTIMGRRFFEGHIPSIARSLARIASSLEVLTEERKKRTQIRKDALLEALDIVGSSDHQCRKRAAGELAAFIDSIEEE